MSSTMRYVGFDVHAETICAAVAEPGTDDVKAQPPTFYAIGVLTPNSRA